MTSSEDQQFCLRWKNFQANITSQFEALRDDEDFTDVTIACDGQQVQAHKIILSACSPLFKQLLKSNPCSHPIIFMRDVEAQHIVALMEFMYAGEVNVAQAQLSTFLKTAEALKIRGLTDTASKLKTQTSEETAPLNTQPSSPRTLKQRLNNPEISSCNSIVTSSQDVDPLSSSTPPTKRFKTENNEISDINNFLSTNNNHIQVEPKHEIVDYFSDDDGQEDGSSTFNSIGDVSELVGGMEIIPQTPYSNDQEETSDTFQGTDTLIGPHSLEDFVPFTSVCRYDNDKSPDRPHLLKKCLGKIDNQQNRWINLGEGIEINEDQLRSVKLCDYRKLTRGLATILFSPKELATCSVTGQRWSRAGNGERPVKPALDRAKVQAIISYVAMRFPMIEISRIKQVLAYKCKENSTAFKMKAVRFYGDHQSPSDN